MRACYVALASWLTFAVAACSAAAPDVSPELEAQTRQYVSSLQSASSPSAACISNSLLGDADTQRALGLPYSRCGSSLSQAARLLQFGEDLLSQ